METLSPSIEPQVQDEAIASTVTPPPLKSEPGEPQTSTTTPSQTPHNYSTRSKERQKEHELEAQTRLKQQQHNVVVHPRLKPVPFKQSDLDVYHNQPVSRNPALTANNIEFYSSDDNPYNKRGFKYKPCRPNPVFASNLYASTDSLPYTVRTSYFDRSPGVLFDATMANVTTTAGWRSTRTNIGIREGSYYFEFNIVSANEETSKSHVRIGLGRREASLEAPVGFDGYSYGFRDVHGEFMTLSRPKDSHIEGGFQSGDVVGFLVELPSLAEHHQAVEEFVTVIAGPGRDSTAEENPKKRRKAKKPDRLPTNSDFNASGNIVRDQIPIKYKNALYYEQYEYTNTKAMDHLLNPVTIFGEKAVLENNEAKSLVNLPTIPQSRIRIFKNGVEQPKPVENLYSFLPTDTENEEKHISYNERQQQNPNYHNTDDGSLGYYPMMSVFQGGIVGINPGPDFKYPPKEDVKPLQDRYDETVVEEWYWDLLDEVEAEYLDSFEVV